MFAPRCAAIVLSPSGVMKIRQTPVGLSDLLKETEQNLTSNDSKKSFPYLSSPKEQEK